MNSADTKPKSRAEREEEEKIRRRAENATIVAGLKQALDNNEQLLGFARGRLAGGIRGKLSLGPEAFFAPFVNIGLTERRVIIQHINVETGQPGEILPHYYALGDIAALNFSDIETFGGESAARLTMRLRNDQHTRLRLRGLNNLENAQAIIKVFQSLTLAPRSSTTPTQRVCATCHNVLDQPFKFCPYCGQVQDLNVPPSETPPVATPEPERTYPPTPPGPTEPEFLDTLPYQDAGIFKGPTVEDGLDLMSSEPAPPPVVPDPAPEPEATPTPTPVVVPHPEASAAPVAEPEAAAPTPVEDAAFETPSAFEGWSVDPGANAAVVEPTPEEEVSALTLVTSDQPTATEFNTHPSGSAGYAVDTEASIVDPVPQEASASPETSVNTPTDVSPVIEVEAPVVQPEAEFAPAPDAVAPESAHAAVTFEAPLAETDPTPHPEPDPLPETSPVANPDFVWTPDAEANVAEVAPMPLTEPAFASPTEFAAPPATESYAPSATPSPEQEIAAPEAAMVAPAHESAGFVMEPVAVESPTPVNTVPAVPEFVATSAPPVAAVSPAPYTTPVAVAEPAPAPVTPEPSVAPAPPAPEATTLPTEDRFASLLREIRGGDAPVQPKPEPPPAPERRDGPMSVHVHIMRPPINVNETFTGRNSEEIVGKLKARVLPELNFALRLMVNGFTNLRFAQEVVRRYNDAEKTSYPIPNSCWEFLQNAEEMNYVTIQLQS